MEAQTLVTLLSAMAITRHAHHESRVQKATWRLKDASFMASTIVCIIEDRDGGLCMDGTSLMIFEGVQKYFCKKSESPSTSRNTLARMRSYHIYNTVGLFRPPHCSIPQGRSACGAHAFLLYTCILLVFGRI